MPVRALAPFVLCLALAGCQAISAPIPRLPLCGLVLADKPAAQLGLRQPPDEISARVSCKLYAG